MGKAKRVNGDGGLRSEPWLRVEVWGSGVPVDGVPVQSGQETNFDRLDAVQQIAREVALPLGRPVGATLVDHAGALTHVSIHPDGTVESIEDLVRQAAAPVLVPEQRAPSQPEDVDEDQAPNRRRRQRFTMLASLVAVSALATAGVAEVSSGAISRFWNRGPTATSGPASTESAATLEDPGSSGVTGAAAASGSGTGVPSVPLPVSLSPGVGPDGPCRIRVALPPQQRPVRVTVRVVTSDGAAVQQRLLLGSRRRTLVFDQLAPGRASWRVFAGGVPTAAGHLRVMPPPVPAAIDGEG